VLVRLVYAPCNYIQKYLFIEIQYIILLAVKRLGVIDYRQNYYRTDESIY
jgi:hypothetical protein